MMIPVDNAAAIFSALYFGYWATILAYIAFISMIPTEHEDWREE